MPRLRSLSALVLGLTAAAAAMAGCTPAPVEPAQSAPVAGLTRLGAWSTPTYPTIYAQSTTNEHFSAPAMADFFKTSGYSKFTVRKTVDAQLAKDPAAVGDKFMQTIQKEVTRPRSPRWRRGRASCPRSWGCTRRRSSTV